MVLPLALPLVLPLTLPLALPLVLPMALLTSLPIVSRLVLCHHIRILHCHFIFIVLREIIAHITHSYIIPILFGSKLFLPLLKFLIYSFHLKYTFLFSHCDTDNRHRRWLFMFSVRVCTYRFHLSMR